MRYVLAPLAGFTDAPFRRLCHEGGADLTYTEMVSAAGLAHGSAPTRRLMDLMPGEGPVAVQLFGSKEEELAFAVKTLPPGFVEVNLNAGCPMTKVTREGAGAISKWLFSRERRIERAPNLRNIEEYISRTDDMLERKRNIIFGRNGEN